MKNKKFYPHVDDQMIAAFKEAFGDDEQLLTEALAEAERALSYVSHKNEWHNHAANGNYELF